MPEEILAVEAEANNVAQKTGGECLNSESAIGMSTEGATLFNRLAVRFTPVNIPAGVLIEKATIELYNNVAAATINFEVGFEIVANAEAIATTSSALSIRDPYGKENKAEMWEATAVAKGLAPKTSEALTSQVQRIVNKDGWLSGNAMLVWINATNGTDKTKIALRKKGTEFAPKLKILYKTTRLVTVMV